METPAISPGTLPRVFTSELLPDGDLKYKIETNGMTAEGSLSLEYALAVLCKWAEEIHETASSGGSFKDTPFAKAGIKIHPKGGKRITQETVAELNLFIRETAAQVMQSVMLRMVKLPAQALIEGIILVVLDMEERGLIAIEGSRAQIWNDYTEEAGRTIKRELNVPVVVKTRHWTKTMRRKALRLYEDTLQLLQELNKTYFSTSSARIRKNQPELKSWEEVKAEYTQLKGLLEGLAGGSSPSTLALHYVCEIFNSHSPDTTWDNIKKARKERKETLEKQVKHLD
jgi:hypothetical protein